MAEVTNYYLAIVFLSSFITLFHISVRQSFSLARYRIGKLFLVDARGQGTVKYVLDLVSYPIRAAAMLLVRPLVPVRTWYLQRGLQSEKSWTSAEVVQ
jgi:hypothetical protein